MLEFIDSYIKRVYERFVFVLSLVIPYILYFAFRVMLTTRQERDIFH